VYVEERERKGPYANVRASSATIIRAYYQRIMIIDEIRIIPTSHSSPSPVMRDSVLKAEAERPSSGFGSHHQAITGFDAACQRSTMHSAHCKRSWRTASAAGALNALIAHTLVSIVFEYVYHKDAHPKIFKSYND
jgi:hypothetical protein